MVRTERSREAKWRRTSRRTRRAWDRTSALPRSRSHSGGDGAGVPRVTVLRYVPPEERRGRPRLGYIEARARRFGGLRPDVALQNSYADAQGRLRRYRAADLRYDLDGGLLREVRRYDVHSAAWLTEATSYVLSEASRAAAARLDAQADLEAAHAKTATRRGRAVLSTCASPAYLARHRLSALEPCPTGRCRHLGPGKGRHCVTHKLRPVRPVPALVRYATQTRAHAPPQKAYDRDEPPEGPALARFLCGRMGLA